MLGMGMGLGQGVGTPSTLGPDLTENLVAHYLLNNNADDCYGDYDGVSTDVDFQGDTGVYNGSSSNVIITDISDVIISNSYTISLFISMSESKTQNVFSAPGTEFSVMYCDLDGVNVYLGNGNSVVTGSIELNEINSIVLTVEGDLKKLYHNGVLVDSGTFSSVSSGTQNFGLGMDVENNRYFFNGLISNVRIYDEAKNQTFITELYNEGYYPKPLLLPTTNGLIAHYPLTGAAEDSTGNYDGVETNMSYTDNAEFGGMANFNGADSEMDTTLIFSGGIVSLSLWVQLATTANDKCILGTGGYTYSNVGFLVYTISDEIQFWITDGSDLVAQITIEATHTDLVNYQITWDNTTNIDAIKIYKNGLLLTSGTSSNILANSHSDALKFGYANSTYYMDGNLRSVRIYDVLLTQQEITDIYNYEKNFRSIDIDDGLVAYYPLASNSMDNYYRQYDGVDTNMVYDGVGGVFNDDRYIQCHITESTSMSITFSAWISLLDYAPSEGVVIQRGIGGNETQSRGLLVYDNQVGFFSRNSSEDWETVYATVVDTANMLHVTGIQDGNIIYIYLNGALESSLDMGSTWDFSDYITIGRYTNINVSLDGLISNVRIYSKALTAEQVEIIYNTEKGDFI